MGVLLNDKMDLFKGVKDVNRKGERKEWCLNVEKMTRLYEFFEKGETKDQEGNELYDPQYKKRLFHSLGLFLFSYLANGASMADIAELRYDDFYYSHGQQAMRFVRQKTMRETDGMEERPTPTWCRHSYATNLRDAGVSTEYISTMMGHTMTSGSATTLNYLSRYNMATMVTNNSKLLSTKDKSQKKAELVERLMEMDQEKLEAMLKLMG